MTNPNPSPELREVAIQAVLHEAREKGADSPMDYGDAEQIADAVIAALSQTLPAPGEVERVLVPRVPTEAMLKAGQAAADDHRWKWCGYGPRKAGEGLDGMMFHVREAFTAMLAASPEPAPASQESRSTLANPSTFGKPTFGLVDAEPGTPTLATVAAANDEGVAEAFEAAAKVCDDLASTAASIQAAIELSGGEAPIKNAQRETAETLSAAIRLLSQEGGK